MLEDLNTLVDRQMEIGREMNERLARLEYLVESVYGDERSKLADYSEKDGPEICLMSRLHTNADFQAKSVRRLANIISILESGPDEVKDSGPIEYPKDMGGDYLEGVPARGLPSKMRDS